MTGSEDSHRLETGERDRIGVFAVLSRLDREIVPGEDDHDLVSRLSLLLDTRDDEQEGLTVTRLVRCHNLFGHAHIAAIYPGHLLIFRSILERVGMR
ncbi:DUF2867 domain-containing protein [Methylorubrum extorquens]|uniref:DUF2867 domain-containing protein n=1 Tax=Methylorubrum extorquens TaxID=408 RepID=UPI002237B577|nr:DUF2867 domain-containing protein [Methylorubrum extorquens]UYW32660.1 DUF2867 domain-containing protein [Methylorubrum extorquens]